MPTRPVVRRPAPEVAILASPYTSETTPSAPSDRSKSARASGQSTPNIETGIANARKVVDAEPTTGRRPDSATGVVDIGGDGTGASMGVAAVS